MDNKDKEFLQRIKETFRIEAEEHLKSFSLRLNELEKEQNLESLAEIIEIMFREVHSLKGSARSIGQKEIESVCQPMENLFSLMKRKELKLVPAMFDIFYKTLEFLFKLISADSIAQIPGGQNNLIDLIQQINAFVPGSKNPERKEDLAQHIENNEDEFLQVVSEKTEPVFDIRKGVRYVNTEVVRIPISKLNPLLLQAEEFIQSKISFNELTKDIKVILNYIIELKTESRKLRERRIMPTFSQWNEWQVASELKLNNMEGLLTKVTHSMERDGFSLERMVDDHLDAMKHMLLLPVSSLTEAFPAMVREISRNLQKEIDLIINGSELEIDKRILEELKDPLIHLIRNSIDHGISNPKARELQNKPLRGRITLSFIPKESGLVEITVTDDGKGIDEKQVLKAAIKSGMLSKEDAEKLNREEILSLIYQSGLSTSSIITDLSGHGLGMTIVREKVEKLNGKLSLETKDKIGTTFRILLPMTLTTFRGIMVSLGEFIFIVPTINVKMVLRVKADEISTVENHETIRIGNDILPVVSLAETLGIPERRNGVSGSHLTESLGSDYLRIIVLGSAEKRLAFKVDEVLDEQQVLVKGLGKLLYRVNNISGATILGSGKIVPVLNIADLMKSGIGVAGRRRETPVEEIEIIKSGRILIAEDSITSRTLLKNILETAGYQVTTSVDGLDAYTHAKSEDFDVIVSDVDMPKMNGFELTIKIRKDKKLNEIPVILVTALESREDKERGIEAGADAYIIKSSFDQGNLLEVIKKLIK